MSTQRLFQCLFWTIPWLAASFAGTETELRRTAVYQAVIPELSFRTSDFPQVESRLLIINSHADLTLIELEMFFADGTPAAGFFNERSDHTDFPFWAGEASVGFFEETGKYYRVMGPHSLLTINFPGHRNPLRGRDFSGWAILRSNRLIEVVQTTRVTPGAPFEGNSEVMHTARPGPSRVGSVSVGTWRCEFSNLQGPAGYIIRKSGVTITNPHENDARIRLQIGNRSRELTLLPRAKETFLIDELFTIFPESGCGNRERMEISTEEGAGFASTVVEVIYPVDLRGRPVAAGGYLPPSFGDPFDFLTPFESNYAFPEEVLHQLQFRNHEVSLTRFGFVVRSDGDPASDRVFAYPLGGTSFDGVGLAAPPEEDLVFVYGSFRQSAVVFSSGRAEFTNYAGCCGTPPTFERLEPHLVRAELPVICGFARITIDIEQEKIVGAEIIPDSSQSCFD